MQCKRRSQRGWGVSSGRCNLMRFAWFFFFVCVCVFFFQKLLHALWKRQKLQNTCVLAPGANQFPLGGKWCKVLFFSPLWSSHHFPLITLVSQSNWVIMPLSFFLGWFSYRASMVLLRNRQNTSLGSRLKQEWGAQGCGSSCRVYLSDLAAPRRQDTRTQRCLLLA